MADVLVVAHRRGVVHRDLTPNNIMITRDGAKIIDFGVAVTVEAPRPSKGEYVLAPPTRWANDFAGAGDPADDVYALGVLLYQMVVGRSPFGAAEAPPATSAGMNWVAPTPVLAVAGLPREVAEICRRCMAKRPSERPDATAVALDLWALIVPPTPTDGPPDVPSALELPHAPGLPAPRPEPPARPEPPPVMPRSAARPSRGSGRRTLDLAPHRRRRPASPDHPATGAWSH